MKLIGALERAKRHPEKAAARAVARNVGGIGSQWVPGGQQDVWLGNAGTYVTVSNGSTSTSYTASALR